MEKNKKGRKRRERKGTLESGRGKMQEVERKIQREYFKKEE